jgi:triacylglycerol lipase
VRTIRRAAGAAALTASIAVASTACVATNQPSVGRSSGKTPIVFIHGYTMQNVAMWSLARTQFAAAGYANGDFTEFNYNSTIEGAEASAKKLERVLLVAAAESPTGKVDIVAHSEGNLVAETCMLFGACNGKVDHWVNLAGAQNGTALASAVVVGGGGAASMNPLSLLVTRVNAAERQGKLAEQNVKTIVFYTLTDGVILPGDLCKEAYAKNVPFVGTHLTVYNDVSVIAQSLNFIKNN